MAARSKARKRALDVLFAAEMRGEDPMAVLAAGGLGAGASAPANPYTGTLVAGVVAHQAQIDEMLDTYSAGWPLDRMPAVDRNVLRIATYEIVWADDVPAVVAIDEAVRLVTQLSTDESPAFVNGLLARILELRDQLR